MKRKARSATMLLLAAALIWGLSACSGGGAGGGGQQQPTESAHEDSHAFVFTGTTESNTGRLLNCSITGEKDGTLAVAIRELPLLEVGGRWELVEGKGYKVYLDDGNDTIAYAQYDTQTQSFSLSCYIDMGSYGMQKVSFSCEDPAFAEGYDGVGLGKTPPAFLMTDGWGGGIQQGSGKMVCGEDGTVTATATAAAGIFVTRTGTWSYDEAADRYEIVFSEGYDLSDMAPNGVYEISVWSGSKQEENAQEVLTVEEVLDPQGRDSFRGPIYAQYNSETGQYETQVHMIWTWGAAKEQIAVFQCAY